MTDTESDIQEVRRTSPSGWMELSQRDDLEYLVDALLECPPNHTGSLQRLSERTGIDRPELVDHLEFLERLEVVELEEEEYTIMDESIILQELFHLNSALNKKFGQLNE